jgi:hypothetical protein
MPVTLRCNPSGDFDLSNGGANVVLDSNEELPAYVVQHAREQLSLFAGENYLDQREGFPYFQVVQNRPDMAFLRSLYVRGLKAVPGVADVKQIGVGPITPGSRLCPVDADLALTDGTILPNVAYLVPWMPSQSGGAITP